MKDGQSIIGVNAHLNYMHDRALFYERMRRLNPSMIVGYIDDDKHGHLVAELKRTLPDSIVVARMYHPQDGAFHMRRTDGAEWVAAPEDTINWLGSFGRDGLVCSLLNEPGTSGDVPKLVNWITRTLEIATQRGVTTCIGNFSTGTPGVWNDEWESGFDAVLKALSGSKHYLGLHEYLPGEKYRVGRLYMALTRCEKLNIAPPQIFVTEFGVDTDGGVTSGYKSRGWAGQAYANMLCDAARRFYLPLAQSGVFGGAAVFSYGNSGGWEAFDVEGDQAFWDTLLRNAPRVSIAPAAVVPPAPPKPAAVSAVNSQAAALVSKMQAMLDELKEILAKG